ncbi:MAG: hypothetical protein M1816_001548 [Peltula sp. TS41687]|nr:MAG: hypothetical protein M1816_001548 [Peltula sp. TS41687]
MASSEITPMDVAIEPFRIAMSKPAWRAYIGAILFTATSLTLLGCAFVSYGLFYTNYIPQINVERIVHLQFGTGFPSGVAYLANNALVAKQPYDVLVHLDLPRSPSNLAAGNFMLDLSLLATPPSSPYSSTDEIDRIAHSRRTALLTYTSPLTDHVIKAANVLWLVMGWKREAEQLHVLMMEGVDFRRSQSGVPKALKLEIQTGERLMIYSARVEFIARFKGIRWMMYNHRILSLLVFSTLFYLTSLISAAGAWALFLAYSSRQHRAPMKAKSAAIETNTESETASDVGRRSGSKQDRELEQEEDEDVDSFDISDTPRTFPTSSRQPRLRYLPTPRITPEVEQEQEENSSRPSVETQPSALDADDEDEMLEGAAARRPGWRTDSGIGTSLEEGEASDRAAAARRRRLRSG